MGRKGNLKLSLRFNWPNESHIGCVASTVWFIGGVFVISLNKYISEMSSVKLKHENEMKNTLLIPNVPKERKSTCPVGNHQWLESYTSHCEILLSE